jgi:hypothetical protein
MPLDPWEKSGAAFGVVIFAIWTLTYKKLFAGQEEAGDLRIAKIRLDPTYNYVSCPRRNSLCRTFNDL